MKKLKGGILVIINILAASFVMSSCGINKDVYQRDMNRLLTQNKIILNERDQCQLQLKNLGKEKGRISSDLQSLLQRIEEMKAVAKISSQLHKELVKSLKTMVDAGKLKVTITRGILIVELPENILFPTGSSQLKAEGQQTLWELTKVLVNLTKQKWQIAGHTDTVGDKQMNWRLSTERALSVVRFIVDKGMPPERLSATGFGQYSPIASNETEEGRRLNRRIEVTLIPNLEDFQMEKKFK